MAVKSRYWPAALTAAVASSVLTSARAADLDSYATASAGVVTATDHLDGPSYANSGASLGAAVRFNPILGLILDAEFNRDSSHIVDIDETRQQIDLGAGYLGSIGEQSSWFIEGVFAHVAFNAQELATCVGNCGSEQHDGLGVKAGIIWPFADLWVATVSGGYIDMGGSSGFNPTNEASIDGSIGYKINAQLTVGARTDYTSYVDRYDTGFERDFFSWRGFVSYHF